MPSRYGQIKSDQILSERLRMFSESWGVGGVANANWRDIIDGRSVIRFPKAQPRTIGFILTLPLNIDLSEPISLVMGFSLSDTQGSPASIAFQLNVRFTSVGEDFSHPVDQSIDVVADVSNLQANVRGNAPVFNLDETLMSVGDTITFELTRLVSDPSDDVSADVLFHGSALTYRITDQIES